MTFELLVLTTSYPLDDESTSGVFVARLVLHYPADVRAIVLTPSDTHTGVISRGVAGASVRMFRYAPRRLQILAHAPGGIPAALRRNRWAYLLVPLLLASMFIHALWHARSVKVIHANWAICGLIGGLVGWLLGKPVVTTLRGEDVTRAQRAGIDRLILRGCMKLSARVVAVSQGIHEWIVSEFPSCASRLSLIENGVEPPFLKVGEDRDTKAKGCFRLLCIGSLIPRKNVDQVLLALEKFGSGGEARLAIVGDGAEKQRLLELAQRLGIAEKVDFIGRLAPRKVPGLFAEADALVLASRSEGRPNVVLEAMASGLPVIATDIPGVRELVTTGKTGLLFPCGDTGRLAECMRVLASDPALCRRLGENARRVLVDRSMTWDNTAQRYHRLFMDLVDHEKCAASLGK